MDKKRFYAGIGSRKTPSETDQEIERIVDLCSLAGYTLRSGGADGADKMFESHSEVKEIYLPWRGFNDNQSDLWLENMDLEIVKEASEIANRYHPSWGRLSPAAKKLMTRNVFQVLGKNLKSPVDFIVCWTEDGKISGGTGQAMRIAKSLGIPIFNLYYKDCFIKVRDHILNLKS